MKKLILSKENKQINNSIIENNKFIRNFSNCKLEMKNTLTNNDFITLNKDNKIIKMNYVNKLRNIIKGIQEDNKIIYPSIEEGVDLKYEVLDDKLKESIVINELQDNYQYDFELDIGDLVPSFNKENSTLELKENNKTIYRLLSPYMVDNKKDYSSDCAYEIEQNENKLNIKLICSSEWINSPDRTLPIVIDPTIEIFNDNIISFEQYIDDIKTVNSENNLIVRYDITNKSNQTTTKKYSVKYIIDVDEIKNKYEMSKILDVDFFIKPINFSNKCNLILAVNRNPRLLSYSKYSKGISIGLMGFINKGVNKLEILLEPENPNKTTTLNGTIRYGFETMKKSTGLTNDSFLKICYKERSYKEKEIYTINNNSNIKVFLAKRNLQYELKNAIISSNSLKLNVNHIFDMESYLNNESNNFGIGWKLNVQQSLTCVNADKLIGSKEYIYIDGDNNKNLIIEKWYYTKDGKDYYVSKEDVYLDDDYKLKTRVDTDIYEVKYSAKSEDDTLTLINMSNLNNYNSNDNLNNQERYYILIGDYKFYCIKSNSRDLSIPNFTYKENNVTYTLPYQDIEFKNEQFIYKKNTSKIINMSFIDSQINFDEDGIFVNHAVGALSSWDIEKTRINLENNYNKIKKVKNIDIGLTDEIESLNQQIHQVEQALENYNKQLNISSSQYGLYKSDETLKKVYRLDELKEEIKTQRNNITNAITDGGTRNRQISYDQANDNYEDEYNQYEQRLLEQKKDIELNALNNNYDAGMEYVKTLKRLKTQRDTLIQEQYKKVNNIIIDKEENILGFDGYGRLIQIQDKYENKIEIEYNYEEENLNQIKRIYSSNEEIKFNYDKKNKLLVSIIDNKGKLIRYSYNEDNLQYIVYPELDKANRPLTTSLQIDSNHIEIITPLFEMFSAVMSDNIIDIQKGYLNLSYDTLYIDNKTVIKGFDKKLVEQIHYEYRENQTIVDNPKLETQTIYDFDDNGNIYGKSVNEEYEYSFIQDELVLFKSYLGATSKIESGTIEGDNEVKTFTLSSTKPLVLCLNFHEENELNLRIESANRIFNQNIKITNTKPIYIPFFVDRLKATNVKMIFKLKNSVAFDYIIYKGKDGELYNYNDKKIILKQTLLYDEEYEYEDELLIKQINKNIYNEKVVTTYSYNPNKLLTLIEDSKGNVQEYHYDEKGNCIETKSYNKEDASLMKIEKNSYDEKGNVIFSEGPIKNKENKYPKQEIKYINNLVNKIIGYNNETTVYNYDYNNGNLLSISSSVDGTNNSTAFTYNYGLLTSMSNQSMKIEYGYDGKKRRVLTKLNGLEYLKTIYEERENSRITIVNITYDGLKTIQEISEEKLIFQNILGNDGEINLNYNYDGEDRLLAVDYTVNVSNNSYSGVEEYDYNEFDILSRYQKYINNNLELKIENIYDENYRYLISKNTSFLNYNIKEEYTYNDKKQINKVDLSLDNEKIISFLKYDSLNRIKHQQIINNEVDYCHEYSYLQQDENSLDLISEDILKIKIENKHEYYIETNKYQYDVNGNIINISQDDIETKYIYDSINRLVQEENPLLNKTIKYKYDKAGNIILTKEYDNKSKELILTKEYIYDCDNQDRLISFNNEMISYDEIGRPLIYRNKELTWNNQNQLLRINNDIKYQYDVNGIRACKLVKGLETRYITQNNQIICEENNNGIIIYQYILNKLVGFTYTTSSGTKNIYI